MSQPHQANKSGIRNSNRRKQGKAKSRKELNKLRPKSTKGATTTGRAERKTKKQISTQETKKEQQQQKEEIGRNETQEDEGT